MTKARWSLVLPLIVAGCDGSSTSHPTPAPPELRSDKVRATAPAVSADDAATFAGDNVAFAVDMHHQLRATEPGNFIFSQTSISTALAMLYAGAGTTTATEMATALHFGLPGERLHPAQWLGVLVAFGGVVLAFFNSGKSTLVGDLCGVAAAFFWSATTVLIRATRLAQASATKTLFYQLGVSAALLPMFSFLFREPGITSLTPLALASLAYQGVIVAFLSYLAWFWLLGRYLAARLSVFSFLAPMFGVLFGVVFLSEPLGPQFAVAAGLVGLGIVLVNLRR